MTTNVDWSVIREKALARFTLAALPPTLKLPALPHAVALFIDRAKDERVPLQELAKIIETDSGLTLELLKNVNSSHIGLRQKAKSVQQAIALLGIRQTKLFIISSGTQAAVRARSSKLINQNCFWNFSLQKALFAKEIAKILKADEDLAFAGALLQDYLIPVLTNDLFTHYVEFSEKRELHPISICDFEQSIFGWDHAIAAASMAYRWKLPDDLVCCILFHHAGLPILSDPILGKTSAAAVALSALLPDQLRQQFDGLERLAYLEQSWPEFDFTEVVEAVDRGHSTMNLGIRNDFPLARRCRQFLNQS